MRDGSVVLLIDGVAAGHANLLKPKIEDRGLTAAILNISAVRTLDLNIAVPEVRVQVGAKGWRLSLKDLRSVWANCRYPAGEVLSKNREFRDFAQDEWEAALCNLYYLTQDRTWVNPLDRDYISGAKVEQLILARQAGLDVPRTLVTLDPRELRSFSRSCPDGVAIKRLNNHPAMFRSSYPQQMIYTNLIRKADMDRLPLDSIRLAPCFFQEYVPKKSELRVFVVDDRVFSVEIFSQLEAQTEIDWRHYPRKPNAKGWEIDYDRWKCAPVDLPASVQNRCRQVAREMGLHYAAIDLIKSTDGRYVFLEANNPGAWGWLEEQTGLPITDAIVEVLVDPRPPAPRTRSSRSALGYRHSRRPQRAGSPTGRRKLG